MVVQTLVLRAYLWIKSFTIFTPKHGFVCKFVCVCEREPKKWNLVKKTFTNGRFGGVAMHICTGAKTAKKYFAYRMKVVSEIMFAQVKKCKVEIRQA